MTAESRRIDYQLICINFATNTAATVTDLIPPQFLSCRATEIIIFSENHHSLNSLNSQKKKSYITTHTCTSVMLCQTIETPYRPPTVDNQLAIVSPYSWAWTRDLLQLEHPTIAIFRHGHTVVTTLRYSNSSNRSTWNDPLGSWWTCLHLLLERLLVISYTGIEFIMKHSYCMRHSSTDTTISIEYDLPWQQPIVLQPAFTLELCVLLLEDIETLLRWSNNVCLVKLLILSSFWNSLIIFSRFL